jgi:thymidylate kinase
VDLTHDGLVLIEGSYSHHPALRLYCDLFLFLTVTPEKQLDRIRKRNGEAMAKVFQNRWIPLEEAYFSAFSVSEHADGIFSLN